MSRFMIVIPILFLSFFIGGCSSHVTIKALKPAQVHRASSTKNVAVVALQNDRVGLGSKIESILAKHRVENEPFFTIVNRSNINHVLEEQKLQNSGLVDTKDIINVGNLIGAQAIISGNVGKSSLSDSHFYESRLRCVDSKCKESYYFKVRCTKRVISLAADIKMVDVARGDIIYADNIARSSSFSHCSDDSRSLPSKESVADDLALSIADAFTYKLTPHYAYFNVELLDSPDLDYTSEQKELLKNALVYIEQNRYDKAKELLIQLVDTTSQQSYVAFYNLGVLTEAQGDYEKAKTYYEKADSLTSKPVEAINIAYNRIKTLIREQSIVTEQINR